MGSEWSKFDLDADLLEGLVRDVHLAMQRREGIFVDDPRRFLPQWNLPSDLEPWDRGETAASPKYAALFLWTRLFCDRLSNSSYLMKRTREAWTVGEKNWIFYPELVVRKSEKFLDEKLAEYFAYGLSNKNEDKPGKKYKKNAQKLLDEYDGDPRKLVDGLTVAESRRRLMEFAGIGTGLANLYIIMLGDRHIARVTDPKSIEPKVDVHKGRLPIQHGALTPHNDQIREDDVVGVLEGAYAKAAVHVGVSISDIDAGLWIIGSEVCAKQKLSACQQLCPIYDGCKGLVHRERETGRYVVFREDKDGNKVRVDERVKPGQQILF